MRASSGRFSTWIVSAVVALVVQEKGGLLAVSRIGWNWKAHNKAHAEVVVRNTLHTAAGLVHGGVALSAAGHFRDNQTIAPK